MKTECSRHKPSEKGATIIEYALIAGLIALVAVIAMPFLGDNTYTALRGVSSNLDKAGADLHTP
jgi:Flp pilus assembly pilin Flp